MIEPFDLHVNYSEYCILTPVYVFLNMNILIHTSHFTTVQRHNNGNSIIMRSKLENPFGKNINHVLLSSSM